MLPLLFVLACVVALIAQLRRAGWSLRRTDRRIAYWCLVGMALGTFVAFKAVLPVPLFALLLGGLGAAILYGVVADWQGWWTTGRR